MKKMFALLLALLLPVTGALADVLTDDWRGADDAEIQAAIDELNAELQSRTATRDPSEAVTISGHGTSVEQIAVTGIPARITLTCTDKEMYNPVKISGGSKDIELNPYGSGIAEALVSEEGSYTAMIETSGDWTLTVEPLSMIGMFTGFSGNCSVFTDMFTLTGPTIATVAVDPSNDSLGSFIVELWYCTEQEWKRSYDSSLIAELTKGEAYSYDMILKPIDGATAYAIRLYSSYDGLGWSITAK